MISGNLMLDSMRLPPDHPLKVRRGEESLIDDYIESKIRGVYKQRKEIEKTISHEIQEEIIDTTENVFFMKKILRRTKEWIFNLFNK